MAHTLTIATGFGTTCATVADAQKRRAWYTKSPGWEHNPRLAREVRRIDAEIAHLERERFKRTTFRP